MRRKLLAVPAISGAVLLAMAAPAYAQEIPEGVASQVILDNVWVLLAAVLVIFMQAGFALVEAGLTRAKNVGNIMMKNLMDFWPASWPSPLVGYAIAFGEAAGRLVQRAARLPGRRRCRRVTATSPSRPRRSSSSRWPSPPPPRRSCRGPWPSAPSSSPTSSTARDHALIYPVSSPGSGAAAGSPRWSTRSTTSPAPPSCT